MASSAIILTGYEWHHCKEHSDEAIQYIAKLDCFATLAMTEINWQQLLNAYTQGYFPMAMDREDEELHWFYPETRGIIPLDSFHVPGSLGKFMRKRPFTITTDRAFREVITACGAPHERRKETWINRTITQLYCELFEKGFAHSVECWEGEALVGGLYGVNLGGAFFGESMFTRKANASRVALVHLVELLRAGGYKLLDTQFVNDHLKQFGVVEIAREEYLGLLETAINVKTKAVFL